MVYLHFSGLVMILFNRGLLSLFLLLVFSVHVRGQTTTELEEFNTAYLQYGTNLEANPDIAREAARRAYVLGRDLFGQNNERTAMLAINYANLLPDSAQIQVHLDEAVTIYQVVFGFGSEQMIDPLMRLARSLSDTGKYQLASVYYQRALQLAVSHLGEQSSKVGAIQLELGSVALSDGNIQDSLQPLSSAQQILRQFSDPGSVSNLARANLLLGDYYLQTQQFETALQPLLAAFETLSIYPNADVTSRNRISLIQAYENLGLQDEATVHCLAIGANRRLRPTEMLRPLYSVIPGGEAVAARSGRQDGVTVEFTVDASGFVRDPVLRSSLGSAALSSIFLNAISQFRFAPRYVDGEAVASPNQQYVFRFQE